jgi:hypothetical protein
MLGRVPSNGQSGLKSHTAWMAKFPPPFPLHELHNQKLPKGKEYWGVKDRLKETEGDTHTERGGGEEKRNK